MIAFKRGKNISLLGAALQLLFTAVMLIIWRLTGSLAAMSSLWLLAGGIPLWLIVAVLFYCRQLERREEIELEEIAKHGGEQGTIFEGAQDLEVRPAANRREWMERWIVPVFTLLWAVYNVALGVTMIRYLTAREPFELAKAPQGALLTLIVAFLAFLFSRYSIGMSQHPNWRLLRATGSYLVVNVIFIAAVAASLLSAWQGYFLVDLVVAFAVPVVLVILAGELVLNFVLDLYRPRLPGQEYRPSFDSRLFNLVAELKRVGHSLSEAMNYQFGFEVSKTWFYKLLSNAFIPLIIFGVLVLFALSSVVIVRQGEQHVVFHWGKVTEKKLDPGVHFKLPWPIDTTERFNVSKVHEILLGVGEEREPTLVNGKELYLWTEQHGSQEEKDFLVAIPPRTEQKKLRDEEKPPPVSIIKLVVPVQYVVEDVYKYGFKFSDSKKVLEDVAYREMVRYCASATLDSPLGSDKADRPEAIMTFGRERAAQKLRDRIQAEANRLDLGVQITYVGLVSVHPPADAAPAFEQVLEAERRQDEKRYQAEADANEVLAKVAGDPITALNLALAIRQLEELENLYDLHSDLEQLSKKSQEYKKRLEQFNKRLDQYISDAGGDIKALDEEIERDKLLGKISGDEETSIVKLRAVHKQHFELLETLKADIDGFDYPGQIGIARKEADAQFAEVTGKPAALIAKAQSYRWKTELAEQANYLTFPRELMAYEASPEVYMMDRWLDVWDKVLPNIRKYVLGVDRDKVEVWLNWERQPAGLERAFDTEEN